MEETCPAADGVQGDAEPTVAGVEGVTELVVVGVRGDAEPVVWAGVGKFVGGRWRPSPSECPMEWVAAMRG
jgi:hypothetical protein